MKRIRSALLVCSCPVLLFPAAWPTGTVFGLRARGGFTVDIGWKDGKMMDYRITSPQPRTITVLVNGETKHKQTQGSPR